MDGGSKLLVCVVSLALLLGSAGIVGVTGSQRHGRTIPAGVQMLRAAGKRVQADTVRVQLLKSGTNLGTITGETLCHF